MPLNIDQIVRRRKLLGMTQSDLAITAGISPSTVLRIETRQVPDDGGRTGIDLVMRIAQALRLEPMELMIAPTGNRYQRAVQFAAYQHSPQAAPKLHSARRTVMAENYRALTGKTTGIPLDPLPPEPTEAVEEAPSSPTFQFVRDPSGE